MIGLAIFLGIVALLLGLLAVPVAVQFQYVNSVALRVRWLFLRFPIIPGNKKKPNKKKKEKPPKEKKEPEKKEEPDKPKEPNIFQRFYQYQGVPGFVELLWRVVAALQAFGRGLWRAFYIRRLAFYMVLPGGDDPAALAEKYGKLNAAIYPPLGWLMSHLRSRKGAAHVQLHPDFTGWGKKQMECEAELTVCPLVLIAALLGLLLRLGVRVGLKFLQGSKPPSSSKSTAKSIAKN